MLHGGVSALLAESAASLAAAMSVDLRTHIIAGVDLNATHLRPKRSGTLLATARPLYRGRTTHVYADRDHRRGPGRAGVRRALHDRDPAAAQRTDRGARDELPARACAAGERRAASLHAARSCH